MLTEDDRNSVIGGLMMVALLAGTGLAYFHSARTSAADGYLLIAKFHKAEGVAIGTDIRLSGKVVGRIVAQSLDDQFRAVLTLEVGKDIAIPTDSNASILTEGLFGSKFISLQPGGDEKDLKPGDEIRFTQDSLAVEDLLNMIIAQGESIKGKK